ncbi:MAG: hypothetical protein GX122_04480 [Candidatus Cloacimonetes bacterium]|nr:hypothetical protein [Candidatus Cloacimonadota bacterium]NLO11662.1 hypothetical protein [Candidatus Cloacimonadota bacterium]
MKNEIVKPSVFETLLTQVLRIPGAIVNRENFLKKQLYKYIPDQNLDESICNLDEFRKIDLNLRIKLAKKSINLHTIEVTSISFTLGLPGGFAIAGTIPADLIQYYYHIILIIQKVAYLMGWPDFTDGSKSFDDDTLQEFTLFVGVMFGSHQASTAVKIFAKKIAEGTGKRITAIPLTKYGFYNMIKQIGKWIGVKVTKKGFGNFVAKGIPVVGGIVAGGITLYTFKPMSLKLLKYLSDLDTAYLK